MATVLQTSAGFPEFLALTRFSTADYLQMIEAGILGPQHRVELIEGVIVDMPPAGIPHNHFLINIIDLFAPLLGRFKFAVQGTLTVAEGQVFDPDFMLLQRRPGGYRLIEARSGDEVVSPLAASDFSFAVLQAFE